MQVLNPEKPMDITQRSMFVIRNMWVSVTERKK